MINLFINKITKRLNKRIERKNEKLAAEKFCRFGEQYQKHKLEYYIDKYTKTISKMDTDEAISFLIEKVGI